MRLTIARGKHSRKSPSRTKLGSFVVMAMVIALAMSTMAAGLADEPLNTDEDFEVSYPAAPAVAGLLLEDAGIDNRYGSGRGGGNYIRDVAHEMGPETDFHGVSKTDGARYQCAVADFLNERDAGVYSGTGVVDPAASGATYVNNNDGTGDLVVTVIDECGNGIDGLEPSDFVVASSSGNTFNFAHQRFTVAEGDDGVYDVLYGPNVFIILRDWQLSVADEVIEPALRVNVTVSLEGTWELDLYAGGTLHERWIIIDSHEDDEIDGFLGVGYDPNGATGVITGGLTAVLDEPYLIEMEYDRTGYGDDGYLLWFDGTIASDDDGDTFSGSWHDNRSNTDPEVNTWVMRRQ